MTSCDEDRFATAIHGGQGAFKVPSLRDVAHTAPYLHDGRFSELADVIRFYTETPEPGLEPHALIPVDLTEIEIMQMVAFLGTLTGQPGAWKAANNSDRSA